MNAAVKRRVKIARESFINSISHSTICQLASSYNGGEPCNIFRAPITGSYNICYPVLFSQNNPNPKKWIVRIPIPPCVAFVDEKLESEVAIMRFVSEKTTIPVPRVHGYAFQKDSPAGFAFMLIDYIDGRTLSDTDFLSLSEPKKSHFYKQLAECYIQLRAHEFPHIGSLTLSDSISGWAFDVPRRPLSMELNAQEIEGLRASNIVGKDAIFSSAKDHFTSLMDLAFNLFEASENSVFDAYDAGVALYNLHQFKEVVKDWTNPVYNDGPFVLDHGDLRPHNIRVDDDLNIVGVIDWEWGRVVPVQLFAPPTWLSGREVPSLCRYLEREDYIRELARFKSIVKDRGEEAVPLIEVWDGIEKDGAFLVSNALLYPTLIDTVYSWYFDMRRHKSPLPERVREFLQNDTHHQELIRKKVADRLHYLKELEQLGLEERDGVALPIDRTEIQRCGVKSPGISQQSRITEPGSLTPLLSYAKC